MSSSRAQARKHLNKAEFDLYASIQGKKIETVNIYRLKQKISRLDKLREKYATQKRAQKRGLKQQGMDATAENNRKIKLILIDEMLKLCKTALKKREALAKVKVAKVTKKVAKKSTTKKATKKTTKKVTKKTAKKTATKLKAKKASKEITKKKGLVRSGILRKQGHASSRTKRNQGKRDSK